MLKSWRLGTILGFPVELNLSFLLLLALVFFAFGGAIGVALVLLVFGSVLLHELGHAVVARRLGVHVAGIELSFFGGAAKMVSMEGHGMPRVLDKVMNLMMFRQQRKDQPSAPDRSDALYQPNGLELRQRQGGHENPVLERSAYTYLTTRGKPLALSLLVGGALGDQFGRRRIFVIGLIGFGITSILCAAAPSSAFLVGARALQGFTGALLVPGSG